MRQSLPNVDVLVANIQRQVTADLAKSVTEKVAAEERTMTEVGKLLRKLAADIRNEDSSKVTLNDVLDFTSRFGR
jgi:hypothetical protein